LQRTYKTQEACPVARSLDVIGDRWTLLVLRDLILGRGKFKDLLESLQGISPNLLAQRLKLLEEQGIVERVFYSDHPPRAEYCLTDKGNELIPVLRAMAEWGYKYELDDEKRAHPRVLRGLTVLGIKPDSIEPTRA
jgi:DNA-binding HxlR family transcriptional regulator